MSMHLIVLLMIPVIYVKSGILLLVVPAGPSERR